MNNNIGFFFILSLLIHILLLIIITIAPGINFLTSLPAEEVIFMEIIPIDRLNNLQHKEEKISDLEFNHDAKKVEPIHSQEQHNLQEQAKEDITKADTPDQYLTTDIPTKQHTSNELDTPKPEKLQPEPKIIDKKPDIAKKVKKDDLDLKTLEKTLAKNIEDKNKEKASEGKKENSSKKSGSTNQDNTTSKTDQYDSQSTESVNAKFLLQKKIQSNWSKPPSMRDYNKLKIRVKVKLNINQQVEDVYNFIFLNESPPEHVQNVIKESIIRAIKLSEPFDMLSLEDYDHWQNNSFIFSYK